MSGLIGLESALGEYRMKQAYVRAMPVVNVFGDKLLRSIASTRPTTLRQLQCIKGIGAKRMEAYGADIVRMVNIAIRNAAPSKRQGPKAVASSSFLPMNRPKEKKQGSSAIVTSRFFSTDGTRKARVVKKKGNLAKPKTQDGGMVVRRGKPLSLKLPSLPSLPSLPNLQEPKLNSVYILELEQGRIYVGSSKDVKKRVAQHMSGTGSAYARAYKPTGVLLPRLGNVGGNGDAAERDETLRYMMLKGITNVRGWKFSQVAMSQTELAEAEANIRELFDLCRRCGCQGHFMMQCRASVDRLGVTLRK